LAELKSGARVVMLLLIPGLDGSRAVIIGSLRGGDRN
jgi:hypothetical protein